MNLPFIKNFNKKVIPLHFLVLILRDEKAQAVIFEEIEGKVKIIGQKEEHFPTTIDEISSEELLEVLDKAISSAESSLPENIQTQKTIFGVKESWTENDQIKKEHLAKLKKASEELGLTPIGFLVISQAISHLLQKEEGAPISAILAEVNKKSVTVTLLRAGKSIETKSSEIHESIPFTVDTLLKHFNIPEILPSRIIIFNGKEDLSQEFITHTWSKSLPFLHLPQITNLPWGFDAQAVLFGAATQMGFEVLEKDIPKRPVIHEESTENQMSDSAGQEEASLQNPVVETENFKNIGAEDFGFTKDIDVVKMPAQVKTREASLEEESQKPVDEIEKEIPQFETIETYPTAKSPNMINNILTFGKSIFKKINIKTVFSKRPGGKITFVVPVILILIIVLLSSYFLFMKAIITITVDPKIIQEEKSILFSTLSETDSDKNIIKGEFVTVSEEGSVSGPATGKKDVGTNAKGTVTIFNTLPQSKTFPEGTVITSANGLKFTLDSSVSVKAVASRSADEPPPPSQTVTANVTAAQLGKESNLPSGTRFTVSNFDISDIAAKNDNPFSGGTKKEVTVISKTDEGKLEEELPKQLEDKAREALIQQIGKDKVLLPTFVSMNLSQKTFDAKVGDEANQVTLKGTVEYQGISYDKNDLIEISKSLLEKDVPANHQVDYNNIKTTVLNIKNKNDEEVQANLSIKALLLPEISEKNLTKDLKGKSFKSTEDTLYKLPQISDIDIRLSPNLPFLPKNLPIIEKNIKILIKIDG